MEITEPKPPDSAEAPGAPQEGPAQTSPATGPLQTPDGGAKFPIVGIGASAGGLEAREALTRRLSRDGMAYIVLQHLAPGHERILTEILARGTAIQVVTIRDGLAIEPNTLYVAPPNAEIVIEQGVLHLKQASERVPRQSLDAMLRSLAADLGPMAIGVVLFQARRSARHGY
jgi:two-component system CheB/CheR fusion protein